MNATLPALLERLGHGERLVQAFILAHEGSTPRSAGSRMLLVPAGGDAAMRIVAGTVGGGLVEAQVMQCGLEVLEDGRRRVRDFDLTNELAAGADMICGGRLRVLLERIEPGDLSLWTRLAHALADGQRCLRLIPLDAGPCALLLPDGEAAGQPGPGPLVQAARQAGQELAAPMLWDHPDGGTAFALEPWAPGSALHIFGAGHVSRPTAQIAALCGFAVTVLDDRPDFANAERFPTARVRVLDSFDGCFAGLSCGPETFVVIVTRGHLSDADVLAQALRTRAGYIGMIGSSRKREAVYNRLLEQGFTEADIGRVHCPIGLDIGAETPEEIAVSINAELVLRRAGGGRRK